MQTMNVQKPDLHPGQWGMWASLDVNALNQRLLVLARAIHEITDAADAARRDLTAEEDGRLKDLIFQSESCEQLLARMGEEDEVAPRRGVGRRSTAQGPDSGDQVSFSSPRAQSRETASGSIIVGRTKDGQVIRGYGPKEPLPVSGPALPYDFGQWMKAAYFGRWSEIRAEVAQQESVGGDGGFLVPSRLASEVLNSVKARALMMGLATTLRMDTNGLDLVKVATPPTAYWRGELQEIPASKVTFLPIAMRAHSIGVLIKCSEEELADAANFGPLLQTEMASALALAADLAILQGDGVGKPLGIVNSGVQTVSAVGTLSTIGARYTPFTAAWGKLLAANFTPTDLIMNSVTATKIDDLRDAEDRPLAPPESWASYRHLITNQVEEVGGASTAVLGDFSDSNLVVGMRQEVRVEFSKAGYVNGKEAFAQLAVLIRATMRLDSAVTRPLAFCLIPGITTTP